MGSKLFNYELLSLFNYEFLSLFNYELLSTVAHITDEERTEKTVECDEMSFPIGVNTSRDPSAFHCFNYSFHGVGKKIINSRYTL